MSPEVLSKKDLHASRAMDIWACGIILYGMLFNRLPFSGKNKQNLIKNIIKSPVEFPPTSCGKVVSYEAEDLILKMLEKDPLERINMIDIMEHEWFNLSEEEIKESAEKNYKRKVKKEAEEKKMKVLS